MVIGICKKVIETKWFERFILGVIIFNAIILGIDTLPSLSPQTFAHLMLIDHICIGIFVIELTLKLIAQHFRFFKSGWNIFDFMIVLIAILPVASYLSVFRALRIVRAFRLITHIPALKRVVDALFLSLPGLFSTGLLMLLVFYVFGVIGVKLFGTDFPQWFGHLGSSMFSLFQVMTLESWSMGIARPIMEKFPYAWTYFVPFILISAFVLLNFLIGIVVDALAHIKHSEEEQAETDRLKNIEDNLQEIKKMLKQQAKT